MKRALLGLVVIIVGLVSAFPAFAQTGERCFPETGFCISGRIREYWEQNGGLTVFGFPITPQHEESIEGVPLQVQWFERNRLELHPEQAQPYDVLLSRLGVDRLVQQERDWFTFAKGAPRDGCRYFAETSHTICGAFLDYFRSHGLDLGQPRISEAESLALFGMPLSEAADELSTVDGRSYLTQHFERARLEFHPENQPPYNVLLGLLGNEIRANATATPPAAPVNPAAPPTPTPAPSLSSSYNNCQADPNANAAPNFPVKIVGIDKGSEVVTLQNLSNQAIDLNGWRMCSIKGNQRHPIGGMLAPGERRSFNGPRGNIWNNRERDDGALYDPAGRLVSYWVD